MIKKANIGCYLKKSGILFYFFLIDIFTAQTLTIREIDSLQTIHTQKLNRDGNFAEIITLHKTLLKKSVEINYVKGEITGYIELANFLSAIHRNSESLHYLKLAEKKLYSFHDPVLKVRLKIIYGLNYRTLGLYNQAIESFNEAIKLVYQISDKKDRDKRLFFIYDWKRYIFTEMKLQDSVDQMEKKCLAMPNPNFMIYIVVADNYIARKKLDSAEYYLNQCNNLRDADNIEGRSTIMLSYGKLYIEKQQYDTALKYLMKSLEIAEESKLKGRSVQVYKYIAIAYKKLNNIQKENEYLAKYSQLNDSLVLVEKSFLNVPIEKFLNDEVEDEKKEKENLYYTIIGIILASLGIVMLILNIYKRKQKHKDLLIIKKEEEMYMLKNKLNTTIGEVIELAKNNDPSFLVRFKEVYPEFCDEILKINPQIINSELAFLGLLKLNFTTKEIATYTFLATKSVQNKKNRIRKKLNIPSDEDIYLWLSKL